MKDHGLLYKPDMIRAFLERRKAQTRRVLTRMNVNVNGSGRCSKEYWEGYDFNDAFVDPGPSPAGNPGPYLKVFNKIADARDRLYPIYMVGDRMWAKETWRETTEQPGIMYRVDGWEESKAEYNLKWKSPLFMPKKYTRIWRTITEVRIQRVQEISTDDIIHEGIPLWDDDPIKTVNDDIHQRLEKLKQYPFIKPTADTIVSVLPSAFEMHTFLDPHRNKFIELWNQINSSRGYPWENNDWVIALTLEEIE